MNSSPPDMHSLTQRSPFSLTSLRAEELRRMPHWGGQELVGGEGPALYVQNWRAEGAANEWKQRSDRPGCTNAMCRQIVETSPNQCAAPKSRPTGEDWHMSTLLRKTSLLAAIGGLTMGLAMLASSEPAKADLIVSGTGTDSDGAAISATADFSLVGQIFQIVLTNNNKSISQASVLTNLVLTGAPTPAIALPGWAGFSKLTAGSSLVSGTSIDMTHTIGQEWAYLTGGVASSGFGVGTGNGNLCGIPGCGVILDGSAFGLVGTGSNLNLNGLKPANTYIENAITIDIVLAANSTFSLANITSVDFQYGTSSGEGDIKGSFSCSGSPDCTVNLNGSNPVPEPAPMFVLATALLGFAGFRKFRRT